MATSKVYVYSNNSLNTQNAVPDDVTFVQVDSSVKIIPENTFKGKEGLSCVQISEGLLVIGRRAFSFSQELNSINIPRSLIEIGPQAFSCCMTLTVIHLNDGLKTISDHAFWNCKLLRQIRIPSTVLHIGNHAFEGCNRLKSIEIPNGIKDIGRATFNGCANLRHVLIPSTVQRIGRQAFCGCKRLISIELPNSLRHIGRNTFVKCQSLRNIAIPKTVEGLGLGLFYNCDQFLPHYPVDQEWDCDHSLVDTLWKRFDKLPIHQLCYYHSHHTDATLMKAIQKHIKLDEEKTAGFAVDTFQMTPFHILALSCRPNLFLFETLLQYYAVDQYKTRDMWDNSPLDYLCMNVCENSIELIKALISMDIATRFETIGLLQWRTDILAQIDKFPCSDDFAVRKRYLSQIYAQLSKYEQLEITSLIELAVWKAKMDEAPRVKETVTSDNRQKRARLSLDSQERQACRINCGVGCIIVNVLPFI